MSTPKIAAQGYRFDFGPGLSRQGIVTRLARNDDRQGGRRFGYLLDDRPLASSLGRTVGADPADFLDVFAMARLADGLAPRVVPGDIRPPAERWHRPMHLVVPLRRPDVWQSPAVSAVLTELLLHVSDDVWSFDFTRRIAQSRPAESQVQLFPRIEGPPPLVLLNCGGLDSLLGLISASMGRKSESVLAVSVVTHQRRRTVIEEVLAALRKGLPPTGPLVESAQLRLHGSSVGRPFSDRESTQRTRGPLFLATGVVAAILAGTNDLRLTENGVGAINLPCLPDQTGARATKATHPRTLDLMARLASLVFEQPITITNTGLFLTKGELSRALLDGRFVDAARHTVSCERFPYTTARTACGRCPSCVMRRVSLQAANLSDLDASTREYDFDPLLPESEWVERDIAPLYAMRELVERLRAVLEGEDPRRTLMGRFPVLDDVILMAPELGMTEADLGMRLVRLFRAYVAEFDGYAGEIDRPGWRQATISTLQAPEVSAIAG